MLNNTIHPWKLKATICCKRKSEAADGGGDLVAPYGVAFTVSEHLAVADMELAKVKVYHRSSLQLMIDTKIGLQPWKTSNPWQVAVSSDNTSYFVTDFTDVIKVYDKEGAYLKRIQTTNPQGEYIEGGDSKLIVAGLAVDGKGCLFAGETTENYISKHNEDGTHIQSFPVEIKPWYIAVNSKDHIVVASDCSTGVQILDSFGSLLHTLQPPKGTITWKPSGVCCSMDRIFVAALCGVYAYSTSGDFDCLGAVTKEVLYPRGVAVTEGGKKIAVADEWHVKIFEEN